MNVISCDRCGQRPRDVSELCAPCRAFLLGDISDDPSGRPPRDERLVDEPASEWPFRRWGPLVDLRSPDDLEWIRREAPHGPDPEV
ncbi:MAG: hypothetical protein AAF467_00140 [Actinomycetota bacterium]